MIFLLIIVVIVCVTVYECLTVIFAHQERMTEIKSKKDDKTRVVDQ